MRGFRSLLVLLLVAGGLGAYIYFVESKKDLTDPETKHDKVFTVEAGKIDQVDVVSTGGDHTTLKKTGSDWQIVRPIAAPADQSTAGSLVSTLETLEMNKSLGDKTTSLRDFGLDPARYSVAFKLPGETAEHRLNVGNKTPTGSDIYAQVAGQPKLFLISAYLDDNLNRSTFDLRDKRVLTFAQDGVDALTLQPAGAPAIVVAKKDGAWHMTAPIDARVDGTVIDGLITRAAQAQAKAIVGGEGAPPSAADLKKFGLDKPQLVLTIGAGSSHAALAIGGKKDDATLYARDLSKPLVVSVESALLTDLKKSPDDFRVKDVFEFKPYAATAIDLSQAGSSWSFTKTKSGTDANAAETWKQTKPQAKDANQTAMTDLLNTLSALRADKFAKPLPAGEDLVVAVRSGDASKPTDERVTLRKSGDTAQAIRAGAPDAAVIPTADFDKAVSQLKALTGAK